MKQVLPSIFILLFFNSILYSQPAKTILMGRVIDQEKNEGIAFVSIGIEGTSTGAASNPEGYFELQIPEEHKTKSLFFSAIGYKNNSFAIQDLLQSQNISIALIPQSYDIETVDVAAESKVLQRILRTAFERIPHNYVSGPVNLKLFYDRKKSINELRYTEKSIVDLYDKNGYNQPSWADAFKNRSYQIIESQKSVLSNSFREATNDIDELLELDLVRLTNTIMNPNLFSGFNLKMEEKARFEGDSVWIISYVAKKLDLAHTGSFYPTSFNGKIYISQSSYAVLRSEIHLADAIANQQGRSLAVKTNPVRKIQMNITAGYKKVQGKYVLSFIDTEKQYTSGDNQSVFESGKLMVLEVETKTTRPISGRNYFAKTEQNETFWQNFTAPSK